MNDDYFRVNRGDVIEIDQTWYVYGMTADGTTMMMGQWGNQDDEDEFKDYVHDMNESKMIRPEFLHTAHPFPTQEIGKQGRELIERQFLVLASYPAGVPDEYVEDVTSRDPVPHGELVFAQELITNHTRRKPVFNENKGLKMCFNQGSGFDHTVNFPKRSATMQVRKRTTASRYTPVS